MRRQKVKKTPNRLRKKTLIFQLLADNPELRAPQLQRMAAEAGVEISLIAAYRALRSYRLSGGKLEQTESAQVNVIASILQEADEGVHLSAKDIATLAAERECQMHLSTVYRILSRLTSLNLVLSLDKERQRYFEWRRGPTYHGHLNCINCGRTIEFDMDFLDEMGRQVCQRLGYDFSSIEFIVRSVCDECNASPRPEIGLP